MPNNVILNESVRKSNLAKDEARAFVNQNSWCVIPYIVSGVQNYTNKGYTPNEINPNDAETFKRIWTGNDSCSILWENSVKIISNKNNEPELSYQIGEYKMGLLTSNSCSNQTLKDSGYSEYTSEQIKNYVTFQFDAKTNEFNSYDMLKFYKIPKFSKEDIYRIVSVHKVFRTDTREIDYYSVSFESVNQTFSNSGRARQQNINMSSVGQGYLNPVVMSETEFKSLNGWENLVNGTNYIELINGEYLLADKNKFNHRPAKKAIIKYYGNAMPISISFVGRPVHKGDRPTKLRALRPIFGVTIEQPITPNLQRTSNATNNWYFGEFVPSMDGWIDIMKVLKDNVNNVISKQEFNGTFKFNYDKTQATNPLTNLTNPNPDPIDEEKRDDTDGAYTYSIYQQLAGDEWNQWTPSYEEVPMTIKNTYGVYGGNNGFKYAGPTKRILDIFFDNYWIYKNDLQIPLNIRETKTFGSFIAAGIGLAGVAVTSVMKPAKNWFRFGGLLSSAAALLGVGIGYTVSRQVSPPKATSIYGIVSAPFTDLSKVQFTPQASGKYKNYLPITSFTNDSVDAVNSLIFNTPNSFNFQIQMELTDLFENVNSSGIANLNPVGIYSTSSIGQKDKFETPNGTITTNSGFQMLMNGKQKLVPHRDIEGYIIEQINLDNCFAGDISIEFLDANDNVIYSGIYQSEAKWTGNIRDRWTSITTSIFNNQNIITDKPFKYPSDIIEPSIEKWTATNKTSNPLNMTYTFQKTNDVKPSMQNSNRPKINLEVVKNITYTENNWNPLFRDNLWSTMDFIKSHYSSLEVVLNAPDFNNQLVTITFDEFVRQNDGSYLVRKTINNTYFVVNRTITQSGQHWSESHTTTGRPSVIFSNPQDFTFNLTSKVFGDAVFEIRFSSTSKEFQFKWVQLNTINNFNKNDYNKVWFDFFPSTEIGKFGMESVTLVVK